MHSLLLFAVISSFHSNVSISANELSTFQPGKACHRSLVIFWMVSSATPSPRKPIHQNSASYLVIAWEQPLVCLPFWGKASPFLSNESYKVLPSLRAVERGGGVQRGRKRVKWDVEMLQEHGVGERQLSLTLQPVAPPGPTLHPGGGWKDRCTREPRRSSPWQSKRVKTNCPFSCHWEWT